MINRLKCEKCGKTHRQLTDGMIEFKHYAAEVIEDVIDGVITEEDPSNYPCDGIMKLWREWFSYNRESMEGQIRTVVYRLGEFCDGFLKLAESLLEEIRVKISPGWLGVVCRIIKNAGGSLRTYPDDG